LRLHVLLALVGLAIGSAVFSGCANGDFISTSAHPRDQHGYPQVASFVDWTKDARSQSGNMYPLYAVREHLDATPAPIRQRGLAAFAARRMCATLERLDGSGDQPVDTGHHDRQQNLFLRLVVVRAHSSVLPVLLLLVCG
jgi:hypothetical protein